MDVAAGVTGGSQPRNQPRPAGRRRARLRDGTLRAAGFMGAGLILGAAAMICLALGAVSDQQAIALGLSATLLIAGRLIFAAIPDPAAGQRISYLSGFRAGALLNRSRSAVRRHRNGR